MLPVVDGAPLHLPRVPTPSHQPRRLFAVRPPTPLTPMPRHPHDLPPAQRPRGSRIAPPLTRQSVAAIWAAPPVPRRPPREHAQRLHKGPTALYDVHGLTTTGCL